MDTFHESETLDFPSSLKVHPSYTSAYHNKVDALTLIPDNDNASVSYNKWGLLTSDDDDHAAMNKIFHDDDKKANDCTNKTTDSKDSNLITCNNNLFSLPPPRSQQPQQQLNMFFQSSNMKDNKAVSDSKPKRKKYTKKSVKDNMNLFKFLGMPEIADFDGKVKLKIGKANALLIQNKLNKTTLSSIIMLNVGKANASYIQNKLMQNSDNNILQDVQIVDTKSMAAANEPQSQDQHCEKNVSLLPLTDIQLEKKSFLYDQISNNLVIEQPLLSSTSDLQSIIGGSKQLESPIQDHQKANTVLDLKEAVNFVKRSPVTSTVEYLQQSISNQPKLFQNTQSTQGLKKEFINKTIESSGQFNNDALNQQVTENYPQLLKFDIAPQTILDQQKQEYSENSTLESETRTAIVNSKNAKPSSYIVKLKYRSNLSNPTSSILTQMASQPLVDHTKKSTSFIALNNSGSIKKPIHPFFLKRTGMIKS